MTHASIFIHTRDDLDSSYHFTQLGNFDGPNHTFEPKICFSSTVADVPVIKAASVLQPPQGASEVDGVLMLLIFAKSAPDGLTIIMAHNSDTIGHKAYDQHDTSLLQTLSESFEFDLQDSLVYAVKDGRVKDGVSYSSYFSG